ncbi:AlpA family phage regulatory protein [Rhizobium leguminosarum]|uniref:helix-turn-helix transcriptional regulator n=1 Tax=Rhizobium leguminosarum TaxID=384 RepID=UPI0024A7FAF1|nr:AlpA family phage regulatory protein [Rhizobium leguminosarum]MDI5929595.1 AlpA family phage regulatory protein [Rhizobium leguminosarum]
MKRMSDDVAILVSINDAAKMTSLSRTMINKYRDAGRFPKPIAMGARRVAFLRTEVVAWINERISNGRLEK